jgi:hypothetical protein
MWGQQQQLQQGKAELPFAAPTLSAIGSYRSQSAAPDFLSRDVLGSFFDTPSMPSFVGIGIGAGVGAGVGAAVGPTRQQEDGEWRGSRDNSYRTQHTQQATSFSLFDPLPLPHSDASNINVSQPGEAPGLGLGVGVGVGLVSGFDRPFLTGQLLTDVSLTNLQVPIPHGTPSASVSSGSEVGSSRGSVSPPIALTSSHPHTSTSDQQQQQQRSNINGMHGMNGMNQGMNGVNGVNGMSMNGINGGNGGNNPHPNNGNNPNPNSNANPNAGHMKVLRRLCDDTYVPTQPWPVDLQMDQPYFNAIVAQLQQLGGSTTLSKLRGFLRYVYAV